MLCDATFSATLLISVAMCVFVKSGYIMLYKGSQPTYNNDNNIHMYNAQYMRVKVLFEFM